MPPRISRAALLLAFLALFAHRADAASINYGNVAGATITFQSVTESSVTDGLPLYGAPSPAGDTLTFSPSSFTSHASNGSADTTSGTLSITLQANAGQFLQRILITESGDYALADPGSNGGARASVSGLLTITDLSSGTGVRTATLAVTPSGSFAVYAGSTSGSWLASAAIDLSGLGITRARVVFNNNLQTATDLVPSDARISKRQVTITNTPEPTTAALMGLGLAGLGLAGRRRVGRP